MLPKTGEFSLRGNFYECTCILNGFCSGSCNFAKLLKSLPLFYLRLQQVTAAGLIDDLITLGRNFVECELNVKFIVTFLDSLGFVGHPDKSIFFPARSIKYLGFLILHEYLHIWNRRKKLL